MAEKKTDYVTVRIEPALKALATERAERQGRSLSNYLIELIKKDLAD